MSFWLQYLLFLQPSALHSDASKATYGNRATDHWSKIISTELRNKVFDYYQTAYRDIIKCGGESWSLSSELTYTQITIALLIVISILTNY